MQSVREVGERPTQATPTVSVDEETVYHCSNE